MHAQRGIALPTVIIILLLTASAAGWILYFKNQKTIDEVAALERQLSAQTAQTSEADSRANSLNIELTSAATKIDQLQKELDSLREENTAIAILQTKLTEKDAELSTLQKQLEQANTSVTSLENEKATAQIEMSELQKSRDEAVESDQRGRTQLAELLAQVESGQQNSAAYQAQLAAARSELATTSEQANLLQKRVQALEAEREKERQAFLALQKQLDAELGKNSVNIDQTSTELTIIRLQDDVLFSSGSAQLLNSAQKALESISNLLQKYPGRLIQVEGHTDNIPVSKGSLFPTNWELSAARASAAVRYLINNTDIDPQRLRVAGLGEYNPIAENDSSAGRARNRRIEITLLPASGIREVSEHNAN